jgi:phosphoserine phosphatase RsbU/P
MQDLSAVNEVALEVISPGRSSRRVAVVETPFLIGRGGETRCHLQLTDPRISRQCAAILFEGGRYYLEDRGQRSGVFVNGSKIQRCALENGSVITFGLEDSGRIVFHSSAADTSIQNLLTRMQSISGLDSSPGKLGKLNLLLEATMLLHSQLPLESILESMLAHAISVTGAERGLLLEPDSAESFRIRLACGKGGVRLPTEGLAPSRTAVRLAVQHHMSAVTEDLDRADAELQAAQSIVAQQLRAVIAIPLYGRPSALGGTDDAASRQEFLGVVYLDSRRPAAFSQLDRQILDALAIEAASILDNARLLERERQRQRLEQELGIAREIQQALLPRGFRDFPCLTVTGTNSPCLAVGGDYFDVFPLPDGRTAFLVADVSGKGLGAALLTTMLQGALTGMSIGADPARVFHRINSFLCEHTDVGRYATLFFGIIDPAGRVEFINAGHPSPLLLHGGEVTAPFTRGSVPVGLIPEAEYASACVELQPGDTLVLFSDGVSEAMDPDEEMFGVPRLREVLSGRQEAPLDHLQKTILDAVRTFSRGAAQGDDITLLLIRYREPSQTTAL